jgi:hypothetical protein
VPVGSGEPDVTMTDGATPVGAVLVGGPGDDDSTVTGSGRRGDQSTTDDVTVVVARGGAVPIPSAPPGALTGDGTGAGVPSVQPALTANGRPRATTPKKMDLGDNRTSAHRIKRPKSYGLWVFTRSAGHPIA